MLVKPYPFTAASKSDLINNLALALEQGKITLPRPELAPVLLEEMENFEYSVTDMGHVRTSAPSGQHDDTVMSLALAVWQVTRGGRGGSISVLNVYPRQPILRLSPMSPYAFQRGFGRGRMLGNLW
jgi:hypothetical protein